MSNRNYIKFKGVVYGINLEKLREVCLSSSSDGGTKEMEISQAYEPNETGCLSISSRIEHETKVIGNQQNDMIIYDIVKTMIVSLLENTTVEDEYVNDFGTTLAINTLLSWEILRVLN